MFIRIPTLSLKSPRVTPTICLYQLGAVHLAGCGVSGGNLCLRDHAFPSGLLATPTTVSKTPRGPCVNRVKHSLQRLFSTPKWNMKTYVDCLYAIIVIVYSV